MMYSLANVRQVTAVSRFRLLCFSGAMYCSLWSPARKRHGQEADIHLHHHNHRCIFEADILRQTELSGDAGFNLPSSAGKSLYCNQPDHRNGPTGIFGRDFSSILFSLSVIRIQHRKGSSLCLCEVFKVPIYSLQGVDSIVGRPWGAVIPKSFKTAPQIQPKSQKNCKKK